LGYKNAGCGQVAASGVKTLAVNLSRAGDKFGTPTQAFPYVLMYAAQLRQAEDGTVEVWLRLDKIYDDLADAQQWVLDNLAGVQWTAPDECLFAGFKEPATND
jgi:hypothetical protein